MKQTQVEQVQVERVPAPVYLRVPQQVKDDVNRRIWERISGLEMSS